MMLRQKPSCSNWQLLLLGLIFVTTRCDARAVNVSNTWTMPQEGLNVFYRFFRDRISWFEADAVCQFHHANLVTVDNSFQFDATRDLLRELDVNDIVWIGLMRPQSSDRFMWSNSRPLVADTGYWAESLPLMDAPLCAVIDPIRDYRWHALRCGGPETASFLCEMPVPSWADACNLKDMPNLTLQYMADTASIELIRNCQEEGLLRTMCRGKQDRERALQDLICPRERLETQRINDITNSHFKSLQIINSIASDNNENNDIELLPLEVNYGSHFPEETQTEKNTVQRLIEQFNVDELMQADEPSNVETVSSFYKIPGLIPKPVKKSTKKALDASSKKDGVKVKSLEQTQKETKRLPIEMDEVMMGDQPMQGEPEMPEQFLNEEVSNEILEHLPHIKKTNLHKEDGLEKMEKEAMTMKKNLQKSKEIENKKLFMTTVMATVTALPTTTTSKPTSFATTGTEMPVTTLTAFTTIKNENQPRHYEDHTHNIHPELVSTWGHFTTTTTEASIGHPIHPQKAHSNGFNEDSQHLHTKDATDSSHFIPPMLMVKSHYVPPASKHGHNDFDHHQHHQQQPPAEHLATTTEEQAELTKDLQQAQNTLTNTMMVTATQVLDLQPTTLRNLDTSLNSAVTTTEKDNSMKPITKEMEQLRKSTTLIFQEIHATSTPKTLRSDDFTTAGAVESIEITSLLADRTQDINKNKKAPDTNDDETHELKIPQTSHAAAETTSATKLITTTAQSLNSTHKLYDLDTATDATKKIKEIPELTTTIIPTAQHQQEYKITTEEKLTAAKQQENKEHLQITMGTTEKLAAPQTAQLATISTADSQTVAQPTPLAINAAQQSLHEIEKDQTTRIKEKIKEDQKNEQIKEETVVKTTETLQTSMAATKAQAQEQEKEKSQQDAKEEEEENEEKEHLFKTTTFTPTTGTTLTTTTTVKPFTTTLPQIAEKSTQTSFFSTSIFTSSTTTAITTPPPTTTTTASASESATSIGNKYAASSSSSSGSANTTPPPPTSTISTTSSDLPSTITTTTKATATTETGVTTGSVETSTPTQTSTSTTTTTTTAPETTRNFLKVTTEMPFKPNRRRSLTKPETVSYMKKILG